MDSVVFDAGALIAVERGDRKVQALLERIRALGLRVLVPAGVVAEVWRGGARQARVARLLAARETEIVPLNHLRARAVGALLGHAGGENVIDASVVLCARERGRRAIVVTSDPVDLGRLDPKLSMVSI